MSVPVRLLSFAVALAVVFGVAFLSGRVLDPDTETEAEADSEHGHATDGVTDGPTDGGSSHAGHGDAAYRLDLVNATLPAGPSRSFGFTLRDAQGAAVTSYDVRHERELHLIVVAAENLADFQHVHPTLGADGVWTVELDLAPGTHRVYADTQPTGADPLVVEADLEVTGSPVRAEPPAVSTRATVGEYAVDLRADGAELTFSVSRNGRPVTDLEPYLGAYGHLVAIRASDLAYLHAHPEDGPPGPEVGFGVEFGEDGRHVLYLDFKHDGVVRTATFGFDAGSLGSGPADGGGHDGH